MTEAYQHSLTIMNRSTRQEKKCKEGSKSTMEGGHMLNKLHTKGTMKQQDQDSKDKSDALQCRAETRKTKCKSIEMHSHMMCLQTIENKSMLMQLQAISQQINASNTEA
jgi:hypothetical protein